MTGDHAARVLVVFPILDDELQLVMRAQPFEVVPVGMLRFAAARALDVQHGDDWLRNPRRAAMTTGLEQHRLAALQQPLHQRIDVLLQERLPAGDLDKRTVKSLYLSQHIIELTLVALVKRVWSVAPGASQVAGGQTDEYARTPGIRGLALD